MHRVEGAWRPVELLQVPGIAKESLGCAVAIHGGTVLAGAKHLHQPAEVVPGFVDDTQADQLMPVVMARRQRLRVDLQVSPGQGLGVFATVNALQANDRDTTAQLDLVDRAWRFLALDEQRSADDQPIRPIGEDLQPHGARQPFGTDDPGGRQPITRR